MKLEWFHKYINLVKTLRTSLDAVENNQYDDVPESVMRLFTNIIDTLPHIELDDKQQVVLILTLLNCHMAYGLVSGYTLKEDVSVKNKLSTTN